MRLRAQPITIPCVAFDVRARLSEGVELTPVERITLKAIGAGLDSVADLAGALALNQRLVLDLIYDFWLKGYVVLDHDTERVTLAGEAERACETGDWSRLASAENNLEKIHLLQELVSGAVLPDIGRKSPQGPDSALVPTIMTGLELDVIKQQGLLDALKDAVARTTRRHSGRALTVREAWVDPDQILDEQRRRGAHERRFLSLLADVIREPVSGDLTFELVDAPEISPTIRRAIEKQLTALSRRFPVHLFFKRLHERLDGEAHDEHRDREDALQHLARAVQDLDEVDPGVLAQRHAALIELHGEVSSELAALTQAQAEVRLLRGYTAHDMAIRTMLETAERQVVMGNPWISLPALVEPGPDGASWFDLLQRALTRGVQIVLFWGIATDSVLVPPVRNALAQLREQHQHRFVWSTRPSVLHAKFVVRDASEALLTSYNFFDPSQRAESLELGLAVTGRARGQTTTAILDLLQWARDAFPDHQLGRRILVLAEELGACEPVTPGVPAPICPEVEGSLELRGPALRHWARAWQETVAHLHAQQYALRHRAELLVDRMHRKALARALRHTEHRLVILSDKLSIDVVNDRFVADLRHRLAQGASCALLYRRQGATDSAAGPEARIQQLVDEHPNLSLINDESHAKLLVSDNEVVIGSFNFLSYSGDYARAGRGERTELSVRLEDPDVAQQILAVLAERWPRAFTPLAAQHHRPAEPLQVLGPAPAALQPLFRELQRSDDRGSVLLRWFTGRDAPWSDLDTLRDAGISEALLAQAVGAALAGATVLVDDDARRWQRWLAEHRWRSGDFIGSALLLPPGPPGPNHLPRWLAEAGAAVQAFLPLVSPAREGSHHAAALLAIADLLLHGSDRFISFFDPVADLPRPLRLWVSGARDYHSVTSEPLPLPLLTRMASAQQQQQTVHDTRDRLRRALESAEQVGFRFRIGQHTWERLQTRDHFLGQLRAALEADDASALARYLTDLDRAGSTLEALMDEASFAVLHSHQHRIDEPKRSVCLKRLQFAHDAARLWVEHAASQALQPADRRLLAACWQLRRALADLPATTLDGFAEPVRKFLHARLQPLFDAEER